MLKKEYFEKVALVSHHFNKYLWRVKKGHADSDLSATNMTRADNYDPLSTTLSSQQPAYYGAPPQASFGQCSGGTPSPALMQGLAMLQMPLQQMCNINAAPPAPSIQIGKSPLFTSQASQGYIVSGQFQGQQSQQQLLYQPSYPLQQLPTNVQAPPQQQQQQPQMQGQQSHFYQGNMLSQQPQQEGSSMLIPPSAQPPSHTQQPAFYQPPQQP